jgi:hypothetical protein
MQLTIIWWLVTLSLLYLSMVNSGMLPWQLSLNTSIVGLIGAIPAGFVMPWVFRDRTASNV